MTAEGIQPEITTKELLRLYQQHVLIDADTSTDSIRVFVKVAEMLHLRRPNEAEKDGLRIDLSDISQKISEAKRFLALRQSTARRPRYRHGDLSSAGCW